MLCGTYFAALFQIFDFFSAFSPKKSNSDATTATDRSFVALTTTLSLTSAAHQPTSRLSINHNHLSTPPKGLTEAAGKL